MLTVNRDEAVTFLMEEHPEFMERVDDLVKTLKCSEQHAIEITEKKWRNSAEDWQHIDIVNLLSDGNVEIDTEKYYS